MPVLCEDLGRRLRGGQGQAPQGACDSGPLGKKAVAVPAAPDQPLPGQGQPDPWPLLFMTAPEGGARLPPRGSDAPGMNLDQSLPVVPTTLGSRYNLMSPVLEPLLQTPA